MALSYHLSYPKNTRNYHIFTNIAEIYGQSILENYPKVFTHIMKFVNTRTDTLMSKNVGKKLAYTDTDKKALYDTIGAEEQQINNIIRTCPNFPSKSISDQTDPLYNLLMVMINVYYQNRDVYEKQAKEAGWKNFKQPYEMMEFYLAMRLYSKVQLHQFPHEPTGSNVDIMEYTINNLNNRFELASAPNIYSIIERYGISNNNSLDLDMNYFQDLDFFKYISKFKARFKNFVASIYKEYDKNRKAGNTSKVQLIEGTNPEDGNSYFLDIDNVSNNIDKTARKILNRFSQDRVLNKSILKFCSEKTGVSMETARIMIENIRDSKDEELLMGVISSIIGYWIVSKKQSPNTIHSKTFAVSCMKAYNISNTKDKYVIALKDFLQQILNKYSETYSKVARKATLSNFKQCVAVYMVLYITTVA